MKFARSSACRSCGAPLSWARNERGKWVPLELEAFASRDVPPRDRLQIQRGYTVPAPDTPPLQPVAVLHFRVCPAAIGADRMPMLMQLWPAMATRAERHQLIRGAGRARAADRRRGGHRGE